MIERYLNNRFFTLFILPLFLGLIVVFSFQPFNYTFLNFLILPILFYLIVYIKKKSKSTYRVKPYKKNLFFFGTSFGFGFYLGSLHWITHSLTFDESFRILIPFALILIPLFLSLFFSLMILLVGPHLNLNFTSIFLFSGSLALSDYIRSKILTGFPWNLWSYSFSWATEILQVLTKLGLFAFNLLIITIFMTPAFLFLKIDIFKKFISILIMILGLFFLYIYGSHSINQDLNIRNIDNKNFNIKVISPDFKLKYDLSMDEIKKRLDSLIRYSEPNKKVKTLFIWPEGVFSGYSFDEIRIFKKSFFNNFGEDHLIVFGINYLDKEKIGYYNSLVVVNNKLEIQNQYFKQKLVPFGEFLPFENFLNKIGIKKITEGYGSFLKGENQENIIIDEINILPLICYEIIFPKLVQQSNRDTNLIINISEDAWFGNSIGPHQHFSKAIFRAIEQNSYLVRSANRGFSAIINNKGQIINKLNPTEAGNIELSVPLIKTENKNKNDLIFFVLLITYVFIFYFNKINNDN